MKKMTYILILLGGIFLLTGCFKRDNMDGITIETTIYPIEYLVKSIYGYNSTVDSIYPNGTDLTSYSLTKKQIKEYANKDMFVYNGKTNEKQTAAEFLNYNKNLKIIDVSKQIPIQYKIEELWLCPSNYLMLAQNIKNELSDYISASIVKNEIEKNYDDLKLIISTYDAELKIIAESASNKTIIAGNELFKFLEKYGFKVISVEETDNYHDSYFQEAKNAINAKTNSYVFVLDTDAETTNVTKLKDAGAKIMKIHSMANLTDSERSNNTDYKTLMDAFIEQIRNEVYN